MSTIKRLNDFDFRPRYTPAELEAATRWLVNSKVQFRNTANFCIVGTSLDRNSGNPWIEPKIGAYCHRGIDEGAVTLPRYDHDRSLVATECGWGRGTYAGNGAVRNKTREQVRPFMEYLLHQSPYSRFIITQDVEWCLDWGVIVSADIPANVMMNILIMTRYFYEMGCAGFDTFNDLIAKGINPDVAHVCAFGTSAAALDSLPYDHAITPQTNHRATSLSAPDDVCCMVERRVGRCYPTDFSDESTFYRNKPAYMGGILLFCEKGNKTNALPGSTYANKYTPLSFREEFMKNEEARTVLSAYRKTNEVGKEYHPPNPFSPAGRAIKLDPNQISVREFIECVVPWLNDYATRRIRLEEENERLNKAVFHELYIQEKIA